MFKTWGQEMKELLLFFSGSNARQVLTRQLLHINQFIFRTKHELPLINLPSVDDSYPPQKKSFLMLKYMSDLLGDKYDWFLRAGEILSNGIFV